LNFVKVVYKLLSASFFLTRCRYFSFC